MRNHDTDVRIAFDPPTRYELWFKNIEVGGRNEHPQTGLGDSGERDGKRCRRLGCQFLVSCAVSEGFKLGERDRYFGGADDNTMRIFKGQRIDDCRPNHACGNERGGRS